MGCLMTIFDRLAEDEDDQLMGVLHNLYGPMLQITLVFPSWKRTNIKFTLAYIAIFIFAIPLHFVLLVLSTINLRDHFDLASMVFHYGLIFAFLQITIVDLNKNRGIMGDLHRLMASNLADYRSGRIYDEDKPQALEKGKRKELLKFLCLPGSLLLLAALMLIVPYIKKLSQETSRNEAHYTKYGSNMILPIAGYYPFPTHTGILHGVAVLGQLIAGGVLAIVLSSMEIVLFRVSQAIIFEYKVLQYGLECLVKRAKQLYMDAYPEKTTEGIHMSDPELQAFIGLCLNDCIEHHCKIAELIKNFEAAVKWPGAMAYTFGTGVIGLSLINLLDAQESGNYENVVLFSGLTFVEIINMYILSSFGEDITTESKILRDVLYNIDWHELDTKNRRTMLNFQTGITKPVILKAGGLVPLCMDTFSSIMNKAYTFFNLINAN